MSEFVLYGVRFRFGLPFTSLLTCDHTLPPLYSDAVKEGVFFSPSFQKKKKTRLIAGYFIVNTAYIYATYPFRVFFGFTCMTTPYSHYSQRLGNGARRHTRSEQIK